MKRLIAKPRTKKKEFIALMKFFFEVEEDDPILAKEYIRKFRHWLNHDFSEWGPVVLEHFLYNHKLHQNETDDKYMLSIVLDKIKRDDSIELEENIENIVDYNDDEEEKISDTVNKKETKRELERKRKMKDKQERHFE